MRLNADKPVGDAAWHSNRMRRINFALFMADALEANDPIQDALAIVGHQANSTLAHAESCADPNIYNHLKLRGKS